jgi:uncharacterized protein DUF5665
MDDQAKQQPEAALITEVSALRDEVAGVNRRLNRPLSHILGVQALRGIAFGLGSVLGATIVVSVVIYFLASIDFIPIIGEWAREIADMIRQQ